MRYQRLPFKSVASETVIFDGGINENVSSIELKGGELIAGYNYEHVEGSSGGYVSSAGFERFDGRTKPSSISATDDDHAAQDAARAAIGEVEETTGQCEGNVLAVVMFEGDVYAFRNATGGLTAKMFKATTSGWVEVDTSGDTLRPNGDYHFAVANFGSDPDDNTLFWADGQGQARMFDGTDVTVIDNSSGMGVGDTPINCAVHNDRLWLAYVGGSLQHSVYDEPTNWTGVGIGEFGLGDEITNLVAGVGNALVIFCRNQTKILNGYAAEDWTIETFSNRSGAYVHTAERMFGTIFFMDDRGVTSMEATQSFGDFESNSISQRVYKTLQDNKQYITCAVALRDKNQYRVFFNGGSGLVFSFLNKKLRGVTLVDFGKAVKSVATGENSAGSIEVYFTSDDGYVYQMNSGTSFDGEVIETLMTSAYYHYRSPGTWKSFKELTFEIASQSELELSLRVDYDYANRYVPKSQELTLDASGVGSRWGEGIWGVMVYTSGQATGRVKMPIRGLGSNMGVTIATSEAYKSQHTIQNMTVDFQRLNRQL